MRLKKSFTIFLKDESGQAMIEYILIGALICVACLGSLRLFQPALEAAFNNIKNSCTREGFKT